MATPAAGFDPIKLKESTRQQWEKVAEAWNRWGPTASAGSNRQRRPCSRWRASLLERKCSTLRAGRGSQHSPPSHA